MNCGIFHLKVFPESCENHMVQAGGLSLCEVSGCFILLHLILWMFLISATLIREKINKSLMLINSLAI